MLYITIASHTEQPSAGAGVQDRNGIESIGAASSSSGEIKRNKSTRYACARGSGYVCDLTRITT